MERESGVPVSPLMEGGSGFILTMVSYRVGETNAQTYVYICTLDNTSLMSKNMDCTRWTLGREGRSGRGSKRGGEGRGAKGKLEGGVDSEVQLLVVNVE